MAVGAEDSALFDLPLERRTLPPKAIRDKPAHVPMLILRFLVVVLQDSGITLAALFAAFFSQVTHRLYTRLNPDSLSSLIRSEFPFSWPFLVRLFLALAAVSTRGNFDRLDIFPFLPGLGWLPARLAYLVVPFLVCGLELSIVPGEFVEVQSSFGLTTVPAGEYGVLTDWHSGEPQQFLGLEHGIVFTLRKAPHAIP